MLLKLLKFIQVYSSYNLRFDCYPRTLTYLKHCRVQTKQKLTEKQSYKLHAPTFTGNGSHSDVCLLLVVKIKTYTY